MSGGRAGSRRVVGVTLALALVGGCATPRPGTSAPAATTGAAEPITADSPLPASGYELLEPVEAVRPLLADSVYPLRDAAWRYRVADEDAVVIHRRQRTDEHQAAWSDAEDDRRTTFWSQDDDGNLVVTAVIDHRDRALTLFDPPLVAAYAALEPGAPRDATSDMRVLDVSNPRRQKEIGTATQSIHYVGDRRVRTPLGDFTAQQIEIRFAADLRFADAEKRRTLYVVPGLGAVIEHRREQIVVLGIVPRTEEVTLVLEAVDPGPPAP